MPNLAALLRYVRRHLPLFLTAVILAAGLILEFFPVYPHGTMLKIDAALSLAALALLGFSHIRTDWRAVNASVSRNHGVLSPQWVLHIMTAMFTLNYVFTAGIAYALIQLLFGQLYTAVSMSIFLVTVKAAHLLIGWFIRRVIATAAARAKQACGDDVRA